MTRLNGKIALITGAGFAAISHYWKLGESRYWARWPVIWGRGSCRERPLRKRIGVLKTRNVPIVALLGQNLQVRPYYASPMHEFIRAIEAGRRAFVVR